MQEKMLIIILVLVGIGVLSVYFFAFGIYAGIQENKMTSLPARTEGVITGLVESHLFRNDVFGDVPGTVLMGWGISQGQQYGGMVVKKRVPPWFPCVKYEVEGQEYQKIMGEGVRKDTWEIGQRVIVLYEPENPRICFIQGDDSWEIQKKKNLLLAAFFAFWCVGGVLILLLKQQVF